MIVYSSLSILRASRIVLVLIIHVTVRSIHKLICARLLLFVVTQVLTSQCLSSIIGLHNTTNV